MGLREDLEDICAAIAASPEKRVSYTSNFEPLGNFIPHDWIRQVLAVRSSHNATDSAAFVETFRAAVGRPQLTPVRRILLRGRPTNARLLNPLGSVEPVFIGLLLEASLQRELIEYLAKNEDVISDLTVLCMWQYLSQETTLHLFTRDLLIFLQNYGTRLAADKKVDPNEHNLRGPSGARLPIRQVAGRREGRLLAEAAARARGKAVTLRLTMTETPEIAEHADAVISRLHRLKVDPSHLETFQLASAPLARPATHAELAASIDRFRAFLEQVLRTIRRVLEDRDPSLPRETTDSMTPSQLLKTLAPLLDNDRKEEELTQKFFNFAAVTGAHTVKALLEQARLVRNFTVEIAWYLLAKLDRFEAADPEREKDT